MKDANEAVLRVEGRKYKLSHERDHAKRLAGFQECDDELKILIPKRDELEDADRRVGTMALHLEEMYDARTIRLLAPLIFEDDFEIKNEGDHLSGGFTQSKVSKLRSLKHFGVFQADWPPQNFKAVGEEVARPLREWWMKNREQFGTVYELPKPAAAAQPEPQKSEPEPVRKTLASGETLQKSAPVAPPPRAEENNWWGLAIIIAALCLMVLAAWCGRPASSEKQEK